MLGPPPVAAKLVAEEKAVVDRVVVGRVGRRRRW